jgi:hypothetical protein
MISIENCKFAHDILCIFDVLSLGGVKMDGEWGGNQIWRILGVLELVLWDLCDSFGYFSCVLQIRC